MTPYPDAQRGVRVLASCLALPLDARSQSPTQDRLSFLICETGMNPHHSLQCWEPRWRDAGGWGGVGGQMPCFACETLAGTIAARRSACAHLTAWGQRWSPGAAIPSPRGDCHSTFTGQKQPVKRPSRTSASVILLWHFYFHFLNRPRVSKNVSGPGLT